MRTKSLILRAIRDKLKDKDFYRIRMQRGNYLVINKLNFAFWLTFCSQQPQISVGMVIKSLSKISNT